MRQHLYTSQWRGWRILVSDLVKSYRAHRTPSSFVALRIEEAQTMEQSTFHRRLSGCDVLDIGPGQVPVQLFYFNILNRAIGVDVNQIIQRRTPLQILKLISEDGVVRATKTLGRWALRVDSKIRKAVALHLGVTKLGCPTILRMDAEDLNFPAALFDFIYSRSVFQHIKNPRSALREIDRTLRPGGSAYISIHLWTCPNGYTSTHAPNWEWPHLRGLATPADIDQSRNRLRLLTWQRMFDEVMPGARVHLRGPETPEMLGAAGELIRSELQEFSLDELTSYELSVLWTKAS